MANKALLVTELQNDYLWEKRKTKFPYDTKKLIAAANAAIDRFAGEGCDVIYLLQIFPDTPSNHIIFDFSIAGTEGAGLYSELHIASQHCFEKNAADAFLDPAFAAFMAEKQYSEIVLCGIDECGAVAATAKGARNTGADTAILRDATANRFPMNKLAPLRAELKALGIRYI